MTTAKLMGFPTNLGLPIPVTRHAPQVLRAIGVADRLAALGLSVTDLGDFPLPNGAEIPRGTPLLQAVVQQAEAQAAAMQPYLNDSLWITLGGDHSTSLGTALGLARAGEEFDIVWVDAHADFNTPNTSPSGNPHGMVLALLAGLTPLMGDFVRPQRVFILGARDIDPGERRLLAQHQVQVYGVAETLARQDEIISGLGPRVFLSFDTDSLDPRFAPAVRTPVPGGFTPGQAAGLVKAIGQARHLLAIDLVEYSPDLDQNGATGHTAMAMLLAAAATQAGRPIGVPLQ